MEKIIEELKTRTLTAFDICKTGEKRDFIPLEEIIEILNKNSGQLEPLVKLRAVLTEIIKIANEGKIFIIYEDFGGNTLTIAINDKHTHCGTPNGTFEQLIDSLYQTLIENKGLGWE